MCRVFAMCSALRRGSIEQEMTNSSRLANEVVVCSRVQGRWRTGEFNRSTSAWQTLQTKMTNTNETVVCITLHGSYFTEYQRLHVRMVSGRYLSCNIFSLNTS